MTTNRIQRTVQMSILSTLLVLAVFSFFTFGSASAHTLSHPAGVARSSTALVHIRDDRNGRAEFYPSAITIKSGAAVKIVNKTPYSLLLFYSQGSFVLAPGASKAITPTQSGYVKICAGGALTITVI